MTIGEIMFWGGLLGTVILLLALAVWRLTHIKEELETHRKVAQKMAEREAAKKKEQP